MNKLSATQGASDYTCLSNNMIPRITNALSRWSLSQPALPAFIWRWTRNSDFTDILVQVPVKLIFLIFLIVSHILLAVRGGASHFRASLVSLQVGWFRRKRQNFLPKRFKGPILILRRQTSFNYLKKTSFWEQEQTKKTKTLFLEIRRNLKGTKASAT